ncbi:MAG: nickel-type superoxide dismutase maturation protease [Planctomycetota bacterium]|nr:nickel-type superoxide dismutase maturation protease [Planctomycetota bacterium]
MLLCVLRIRRLVVIEGSSMTPTLVNGDTVVITPKAYQSTPPAIGDLVYARHPFKTDVRLVKRVHALSDDGLLDLRGDNTDALSSTDSRSLGKLSPSLLFGQVIAKL